VLTHHHIPLANSPQYNACFLNSSWNFANSSWESANSSWVQTPENRKAQIKRPTPIVIYIHVICVCIILYPLVTSDWNCTHKKGTGMVQVTTFSASTDPVPLNATPRLAASSQFGAASLQVTSPSEQSWSSRPSIFEHQRSNSGFPGVNYKLGILFPHIFSKSSL